jgi:hypothetical protein
MATTCARKHGFGTTVWTAQGKETETAFYTQTCIVCDDCQHRNLLHKTPFNNAMLILAGISFDCERCGHQLTTAGMRLRKTPLRQAAYQQLIYKGWTPKVTLY